MDHNRFRYVWIQTGSVDSVRKEPDEKRPEETSPSPPGADRPTVAQQSAPLRESMRCAEAQVRSLLARVGCTRPCSGIELRIVLQGLLQQRARQVLAVDQLVIPGRNIPAIHQKGSVSTVHIDLPPG